MRLQALEFENHTWSASNVFRMTETAAAFKEARIWERCSGEYLQFLNCVLPSYKGFFVDDSFTNVESVDDTSAAMAVLVVLKRESKRFDHRCARWLYMLPGQYMIAWWWPVIPSSGSPV